VLCEPAPSLTDLALGLVALGLALSLRGHPEIHRHWHSTFWWTAAAALAGALHHGFVTCSETWRGPSWALISGMVVLAVSYLLAATVEEVLGPGRGGVFWVLRSAGLVAYAVLALSGRAGIGSILLCEGLTMIAILALWGYAARLGLPLAWPVIGALVASGAAALVRALPAEATERIGLDPTSLYHLAQIPGLVLLAWALLSHAPARAGYPAPGASA
jgi:hypothetical protein